jgi:sulfur-oxidizing protein SoxA
MSMRAAAVGLLAAAALVGAAEIPRAGAAEIPRAERRSSYDFMSPETKAMQDEDTANPGMLAVLDGEALWRAKAGAEGKSCSDCHGDAKVSMRGVAARYPAFDPGRGTAVNLETRINLCRSGRQQAQAFPYEHRSLLALTAYIARQSRGVPVESDARLAPVVEQGRALFTARQGQLNLACAHCHDDNWGKKLAGNSIPQGHPTGYPIYRLEWQGMGSLQRRLRNCMIGMRAESYGYGSPEFTALETFLMWRARGMPMESPGVRP